MNRLLWILTMMFIPLSMEAQFRLEATISEFDYIIDPSEKNHLMMHLILHKGVPNDTFYIRQSFKDNPGYLTTRAKGKFFNGLLSDSLIIYNNRAQIIEKGKYKAFTDIHSDGVPLKLDTVAGFGRYGLMGYRDGKFTYYKSGKNYKNYKIDAEIEYAHGFLQGKNIHFHPDGTIHTSDTYFRDTLHGEHLVKYSDGITEEIGYYKMGKKDSLWMNYHPNGRLKDSCFFKRDKHFSDEKGYYENGQLHYTVPRKDGKLHGTSIYYFSDGKLKSKDNYVNDEWDGELAKWYHNGQLHFRTFYKNGERIGDIEYYDSLGNEKHLSPIVQYPDYLFSKYEFVPPVRYYQPTELNLPQNLKRKQRKLLEKAENSLFELDILNGKVERVEFVSESPQISEKKQSKLIRLLKENITTPGIFYNHSYYGGTVTFRIEKVHRHTKDRVPGEKR